MLLFLFPIACLLLAIPGGKGLPVNLGDEPLYNKGAGLYQGDIIGFNPNDDRAALVDADRLWPEGIVPYVIGETAEVLREYILAGIEEYHNKTCVRFVERTPDMHDYVQIEWWEGCNSMVGRIGGQQFLSLGTGCHWKGLVVHELGHAIGFYHEQARSDRDGYIEVLWKNILEGYETQFDKMKYYEHNLLNEEFDYKSIMLYEETAFSKDGESPTVKVKQDGQVIGPVWKKPGLSDSDVRRVNRLYQCFGERRPDPPEVPDIICTFENDDCEFVNQENMGSDFERLQVTLGGRTSTVMVADALKANSIGARLISPYFGMYGRQYGCLTFDYYFAGDDAHEFTVDKQNRGTSRALGEKIQADWWQTAWIEVNKQEDDSRFFFTAVFRNPGGEAKIAIDNVKFTLQRCNT